MGGSKVNEKDLVILEQYDLHVQSTRRGRGSFLCDTDRGLVQVTEFSGSQERLFFQNRVLFFLTERGIRCDLLLENTEGNLVTSDRYGNGYVVKKWFSGRECDTKSREDIVGGGALSCNAAQCPASAGNTGISDGGGTDG